MSLLSIAELPTFPFYMDGALNSGHRHLSNLCKLQRHSSLCITWPGIYVHGQIVEALEAILHLLGTGCIRGKGVGTGSAGEIKRGTGGRD
jgi:hypothetical protein